MGVKLKMKGAITCLLVLAGAASGQVMSVQDRVDSQMAIWGATMAHCRENSGKGDWEVDKKKFKACKKCFSGVGDWFTTDGLQRGMACLEEFEPKTLESCGEMLNKLPESNFDLSEARKIQVCWESVHLRTIGEKCLKGGAEKDMVLASLCVLNHLRLDHYYAKQVILGETPEEQGDPTKPSKLQRVLESLFVEGRCIHANVYLAPAYSDCMEQMDDILEDTIEDWRSAAGKAKIDQLQACLILKQSNYWWKDCISAAGEGIDGLMTFRECALNTTVSWVASRRPQALDMLDLFMKGHGNTVKDGGLVTELV